jgi:hypothetical protein
MARRRNSRAAHRDTFTFRAMRKVEIVQPIAVPPPHVFVFFVPQRMTYWYGREMEACFEVQGGCSQFAVGSVVRISGHLGKKNVSHMAVVTALESPRLLEWRFEDDYGVRGTERWELEPVERPNGATTLVKFTSRYEVPGALGRAMDALVTRHAVARRNRDYLARLARLAEHRA